MYAVSASADLLHWGSGKTDLHVLNTAIGLGWSPTGTGLVPSATVTPLAVERHVTDNVSVMLSIPVTVTPDQGSRNANVAVVPDVVSVMGFGTLPRVDACRKCWAKLVPAFAGSNVTEVPAATFRQFGA